MKKTITHPICYFVLFIFFTITATAQQVVVVTDQEEAPLEKKEKMEVVESVNHLLNENYVFPEVAKEMTSLLTSKLEKGEYQGIESPDRFAQRLTDDLQSVSKDKHLRVSFAPMRIQEMRAMENEDTSERDAIMSQRMKQSNYGFQEIEILEGNIGYLDLRGFVDTRYGGETAVAAMNFLSNSNALIIDLRNNGGGSPSMIQLITSYLYDAEPVHLNNFYWRPTDETTQTWTLPHVEGQRRPDMDVYVLTSNRTFSAAEEFSYNLKNLKRATLIGETTGGGAHPGGTQIATDRFAVWVPSGRAINPITKTNWEGTGVAPHIQVPQQKALMTAHIKALETLAEKAKTPEEKDRINWGLAPLRAKLKPVQIEEQTLKAYAGDYGNRTITFDGDKLLYQRESQSQHELIPLSEDLFMIETIPYFRLKVLKKDGEVIGLEGMYDNGHRDKSMRKEAKP